MRSCRAGGIFIEDRVTRFDSLWRKFFSGRISNRKLTQGPPTVHATMILQEVSKKSENTILDCEILQILALKVGFYSPVNQLLTAAAQLKFSDLKEPHVTQRAASDRGVAL